MALYGAAAAVWCSYGNPLQLRLSVATAAVHCGDTMPEIHASLPAGCLATVDRTV